MTSRSDHEPVEASVLGPDPEIPGTWPPSPRDVQRGAVVVLLLAAASGALESSLGGGPEAVLLRALVTAGTWTVVLLGATALVRGGPLRGWLVRRPGRVWVALAALVVVAHVLLAAARGTSVTDALAAGGAQAAVLAVVVFPVAWTLQRRDRPTGPQTT